MCLRCIFPIVVLLCIAGCTRDIKCQQGYNQATIGFEGFDSASLEQVVVSRYNGYNQKTDSTIYLLSASPTPLTYYDSAHRFVEWPYDVRMLPGEDWEVRVPRAGKTYRITGFSSSEGTVKESFMGNDQVCFDVVTGYYLNGNYMPTDLIYNSSPQHAHVTLRP
jgi:hypothetical protein